jgi:hypothetical protein
MVSLKIESTIPATTTTHTTLITFHKLLRCLVSLFFVYVVFVVEADIERLLSVISAIAYLLTGTNILYHGLQRNAEFLLDA